MFDPLSPRDAPSRAGHCTAHRAAAEQVTALTQARDDATRAFSHLLRRAAKIAATTAAGIYAKALAVRSSHTGAATLAMSLANDLIACPGLRASLWPAEAEVAP